MSEQEITDLFYLIVKIAGIVVLVFNAGVVLILLRQISVMSTVVKVGSSLFGMVISMFLFVVVLALVYSILV